MFEMFYTPMFIVLHETCWYFAKQNLSKEIRFHFCSEHKRMTFTFGIFLTLEFEGLYNLRFKEV